MIDLGNIFILGDSYSTFEGYNPEGFDVWYPPIQDDVTDVRRVEETWWHKFLNSVEGKLVRNCSYSGTTICNTGYNGEDTTEKSFIGRFKKLSESGFFIENPVDTLIIFGATNDSWAGSPLGIVKYEDIQREDLYSVYPAFSYLLDSVKNELPDTRCLFVLNHDLHPDFHEKFKEMCSHYEIEFLPLAPFGICAGHPTVQGMDDICNQILTYFTETSNEN